MSGEPIPLAHAGRLFDELACVVGEAGIGLRVGSATRFEDVAIGRSVEGSLTIGAALAAAARDSGRYCSGQGLCVTPVGDDVRVQRRFPDALHRGRRQANDFALLVVLDLLRRGTSPDWRPTDLHFEGPPPGHAEELAELSSGSTRFGSDADCLTFHRDVLARPLPRAPRPGAPTSSPLPDMDWIASVRLTMRYLLKAGDLKLASTAECAGMSTRTLQRRLAASEVSFAQLVDEARFEQAAQLLRDSGARITDISGELGYNDAANFTRAFRRWSGVSPLAFRRAAGQ